METSFLDYLNQRVELSDSEKEFIRQTLRVQLFKKKTLLLREGEISRAFYFNLTGFVRLFYNRIEGEKTAYFYAPGTFISAYESFVYQQPSKLNLQVTEDTRLVVISLEASQRLLEFSPKFDALARIVMEDELINYQSMIADLITLSPEERYAKLIEENPSIFQKVPQHYIASYIGVQPESLSRIKRRYLSRKTGN